MKGYLPKRSPENDNFFQGQTWIYYLLVFYALICTLTIYFFDGTGDAGDSIAHYFFARYAPLHPQLYFDHWAKPVFVLLASPFAWFGFNGMKVFNVIVSLITIYLTYKTAVRLNLRNAWLAALFMICSPLNYVLTFSGLTEPLFALFTIGGIYLCVIRRYMAAAIVISFLPYVRSEGLIIIGVFAVYFAWKKNMKILPWLLTGSIVYAIAGYFVYEDILWVFTKIPYATLNSVYGSGDLSHFVLQFINVTGVPLYFLFWLGFLFMIVRTIKKETGPEEWALILGSFTCFFIAHSLFWYLGIFNSMGLKRVLLGVMPSAAIIALYGFNLVSEHIAVAVKWRQYLKTVIILYVLVFPFLPNPSAIQWQKDMRLDNAQIQVKELATFIKTHSSTYPFLYNYYYLGVVFDIDHFDLNQHRFISRESVQAMQPGNILIWDNLYAGKESDIHKREIDSLPELQILKSFSTRWAGEEMQFVIYRRK